MKSKEFTLKINNPCTTSWNSMTPSEQGKYCSICAKNVIDFTNLTDEEIISILQNQNSRICGRLEATQINRLIKQKKRSRLNLKLYRLMTGLAFFSFQEQTEAQSPLVINSKIERNKLALNVKNDINTDRISLDDSSKTSISGKILDAETNEPLAGVMVFLL
ncbi:hypothetical protein GCM10027592_61280 [Spirosoma flavus]